MTRNVVADLSDHAEHGEHAEHGHGAPHGISEADVLTALWEQVPFPRLPRDAPAELRDLLVDVENPKMVYNIHRASRRYYLQLLVERFVVQLRYGCGVASCSTSSCFTCRRRLVGKAPIRRYNPTSARTLAIYLAGQDNPESRLCPNLQPPRAPSDSIKPLVFPPKGPASLSGNGQRRSKVAPHSHSHHDVPRERPASKPAPRASDHPSPTLAPTNAAAPITSRARSTNHDRVPDGADQENVPPSNSKSSFGSTHISEKAVAKDYRSFAANVFGSVAFKMLEWLTPNTLEAIAEKAEAALDDSDAAHKGPTPNPSSMGDVEDGLSEPTTLHSSHVTPSTRDSRSIEDGLETQVMPLHGPNGEIGADTSQHRHLEHRDSLDSPNPRRRSSHSRKSSHARIRTSSLTKLPGKGVEPISDDSVLPSPTTRSSQPEIVSKGLIRPSNITRTASQLSTDKSVEGDSDELTRASETSHSNRDEWNLLADGINEDEAQSSVGISPSLPAESVHSQAITDSLNLTPELDTFLPQSMSHFTAQAIDFICNVLQEDATYESHLLEPRTITKGESLKHHLSLTKLKRQRKKSKRYPQNLKLQWKLFVEQSIFSVLSDPRAVLKSFTDRDGLIDSHSIWYCMLRLTRVAPALVFDSLWMALSGLFSPPKPLQSSASSTSKLFPRSENSYTNVEAGFIMSICLHALVAAAPLVTDARQLIDMSRIRAHGLTLTNGGTVARQSTSLCLNYEDTFTDDLALRLAKRLLTLITARRRFDLLMEFDGDSEREKEKDVLEVFLAHLESATHFSSSTSKLERSMHEKRMPILILDWARTVMFNEWEGNADVPGDGPFSGALALMAAMYQKRQSLLLGDGSFFAEYFGERLDSVQMPVAWMTFDAVQRIHLLDHPYLFTPDSRVSYFRAINFSRMSRSYEESSSLQDRIDAIIKHGSLITEQHHKNVLQDLLKVPSARYLILSIGRTTVLEDAFDQLWRREERELMRPLKVHLGEDSGEEGFDSGGVQQEFFRLAITEALNPDYGAFTVDERTRMAWFQPGSLQPEWKFELIGLLVSLAVYNGLTLPVTFPKALYQKLLGQPVTELHHIADGWPDQTHGLTALLEWDERDGSVEDIFALTYEFSTSMFGRPVTRRMQQESSADWEDTTNGDSEQGWPQFSALRGMESPPTANPQPGTEDEAPAVTGDNRNAYVSDYIRYLANISVGPQFEAFARGFRRCLQAKSLTLLTPGLLQSLVEGEQEVDVAELRRAARYVGWDASHRTVRDFWAVVRRYDPAMRRRLLEFVTASDRVPVGGVRNIQFVVQRNGDEPGDRGHLPTAYTCYGTLLLPEYRDREVLRERLAMALENAQGFGFA